MWGHLSRRARWTAIGYLVGFVEGTCAHACFLWAGGIHAYRDAPIVIQVLFHALLVIDALVAMSIARASPAGPPLALAVMLADVVANWWTQAGDVMRHPLRYLVPVGLLPITLFGVFVLVTAGSLRQAMVATHRAAEQTSERIV